ncbi:MAG: histone deacetylase [Deltaproteobacteria bacterium]|nr:MAG: histone deacetylase [Deltaproteobacteria bacterium]
MPSGDMSVVYVLDEVFFRHRPPGPHPERPERLAAVRDALRAAGAEERARRLPVREARQEELERVHAPAYVAELERTVPGHSGWLDGDTYYGPESWRAALAAAAAAVDVTAAVLDGGARRGLALVRPPGHHAEADRAMGFCLFNNVAVAAAAARAGGVGRVAILDWDVHHGNGTQHAFECDPTVLYVSIHQYPYYPGTGAVDEAGRDAGEGFTVNVPLPAGCGDADYALAWERVVEPALRGFEPDLILVSGGFDAYRGDPLAQMAVTVDGFRWLADRVRAVADDVAGGRLVCALEGGYDLAGLGGSVAAVFDAWTSPAGGVQRPAGEPTPAGRSAVERAAAQHARWR